jgi:hypothetical protein
MHDAKYIAPHWFGHAHNTSITIWHNPLQLAHRSTHQGAQRLLVVFSTLVALIMGTMHCSTAIGYQ